MSIMSNYYKIGEKRIYYDSEYALIEDYASSLRILVETDQSLKKRSKNAAERRSLSKLKKRIIYNIEERGVMFKTTISLTFSDEYLMDMNSIRKFFNRMRTYYRKKCKEKDIPFEFEYVWRLEFGEESGRKHFHCMTTARFIPWQRVRKWWECGHIWITPVRSKERAIKYVAKYVTKKSYGALDNKPIISNERRWGTSRGLKKPPGDWKYHYLKTLKGSNVYEIQHEYEMHNWYTMHNVP